MACAKSRGPSHDGLSLQYFEGYLHLFVGYFQKLSNLCISTKNYPEAWKITKIVPLCKKPNPESVADIGSITNALQFAKDFDNSICLQLMNFF